MGQAIRFTKMHGLGNDFMVIDSINQSVDFTEAKVKNWANRHFGVGFDQLLIVEKSEKVDFRYRIFNADGSEVQQCGNGARCFAKFVVEKGLTSKQEIVVETASGVIVLFVEQNGWVKVNMGAPSFAPHSLPFEAPAESAQYDIAVGDDVYEIGAVSMGNPHAVLRVTDLVDYPVAALGEMIESHDRFPERVNVGFAETLDRTHVKLRVYERGAAETLACGTGACAAMVVLRQADLVDESVTFSLPGGDLIVSWSGQKEDVVWMTGPAETVFEGSLMDVA